MTWREEIKSVTASFRGVPFKTTDFETQLGRRNVVHEAPQRDRPFVEDLGKRAGQWVITGHVQGDDYLEERDALMEALGEKGPGELVHPRCGVLEVNVIGVVSVKESHEKGGIAYFHFTVVDAGSNFFPAAEEDTVDAVESAADECDAAAEEHFAEALNLAGPAQVLQGAIGNITGTINGLLSTARQVTSLASLSSVVGSITSLSNSVTALIRTPVQLVQGLRSAYAQVVSAVRRPVSAIHELQSVFNTNARPVNTAPAGSTRSRVLSNQIAHSDLARTLSLSNQARLVAVAIGGGVKALQAVGESSPAPSVQLPEEMPVTTAAQALELRDLLFDQIDQELEVNEPDPQTATALTQLRAAVSRDVAARAELLMERSTFTPVAVLPALALAHRVYGDATRAEELMARNGVRHPTFVSANPLEVLE